MDQFNIQDLINKEIEETEKANNDYSHLNDQNPEFVEFKNVKIWLKMDDDIKTLQNALRKLKKEGRDDTKNSEFYAKE